MLDSLVSLPNRERDMGIMPAEATGKSTVLTVATVDRLRVDPLKSWGYIFDREGVAEEMKKLFGRDDQVLIRPVYEAAIGEKVKKMADFIMIYAHILKIDPIVARRIAATGQFAWGVIKAYDNILDGSFIRNGKPTQLAKDGLAKSLRSSVSALLAVQTETMKDSSFAQEVLEMFDKSMDADTRMSEFDWNTPLEAYFPTMEQMNEAFSWFPKVLGKISGQEKAGLAFSVFQANLLTLIQINNDIKNLMLPPADEEPGIDLAAKIPSVLNSLRRFFTRSKTFDYERELIERVVANERKSAFLNREGMNDKRRKDVMAVLKIWNDHRKTALLALYPYVESLTSGATKSLLVGFDYLYQSTEPYNSYENTIFKNFLLENLLAIKGQFYNFMFPKN